ncbi:hypothetical protein TCAL_07829 [Tigriopus californicus]|uniref:SAM domain-containing protein n=1 Tax=Tigriopus californicus TaxID=6832 RepID=A0A553NQ81_TIGCA|nr:liprin-beta-1-like [Tigriopus californicus]TRY67577.1 hypothetical protein TCAL_07829 [Tigriopus californicus]|eukprot:TCALIF_07829-PA protein Name:"Similar to PPFIBP1 Liprin-beta-1 (Homo sapiens)" AED:0.02 eAED:0.04 QI:0/-1/0/1/-1/1/1/0/645
MSGCVSSEGTPSPTASEASKLLEAALEQMDGIIQGAKFEFPQYHQGLTGHAHRAHPTTGSGGGPPALHQLKRAILNDPEQGRGWLRGEPAEFLRQWLNEGGAEGGCHGLVWPRNDNEDAGRTSEWTRWAERLRAAEAEVESQKCQLQSLTDQLAREKSRAQAAERQCEGQTELLRRTERTLERERHQRADGTNAAASPLSELTHLKGRCAVLEKENQELRAICEGHRTPKYLPISPAIVRPRRLVGLGSPDGPRRPSWEDSSPEDPSPQIGRKEVAFHAPAPVLPSPDPDLDTSGSHRPARGFKKIFGKIKRSNSGGHLEDHPRPATPEFRRGGFRATTGGRLGGGVDKNQDIKRPLSDWNTDMITTWLECLGLGAYCSEIQKTIGTGQQLAQMSFNDLESKLNVKHFLHRKKLYLALAARQDPHKPDPPGHLDYQWVLRWLDDIGLPQHKDAFLEARIDGRVLNMLTVDDLFQLKVTNQLHHLSIRRAIQILREQNFEPNCLKRRAIPGETVDAASVARWTNHRVMEWLKQVDLSEYAPNLRGSGVHGALLVFEDRFNDELIATILAIPSSKTLLRRHLSIHFKELVGRDVMQGKRTVETEPNFAPLTPTAKAKVRQGGQFTLKRKKSKAQFEQEDLLCPLDKK